MNSSLYFIRNGIHTHLILPSSCLTAHLPQLLEHVGDKQWLKVGWGDYRYYGSPNQTLLMALRALFLPTTAVIETHAINIAHFNQPDSGKLYLININQQLLNAVCAFISRHFKLGSDNKLIPVRSNPNGELFFASRGIYTFINTCNNWTSRALRIAGLRLLPAIHFFPGQVENSVRKNGYFPIRGELDIPHQG